MDNDGLPNATDPDTDGDGICNSGGTDPNANPGKTDPSCSGDDINDDNDGLNDASDPAPLDPTEP
jgi:hypothetical protein